jgi:DNA-binding NarL/FixJ family response regulator
MPEMETVLIVDDHEGFRLRARLMLEAAGFRVVGEASDGASGVAQAQELKPSVILLDVRLPDCNGFDLASELEGSEVVMISSHDASTYRTRLASSGVRGFISKADLSGEALAAVLENAS